MKEKICQIGALMFGLIYSVKGLIQYNQDGTSDNFAMSMLFLFVSFLFAKDNDEEDES